MGSVLSYAADVCQILTLLLALPAAWMAVRKRARERRRLKYRPRHAGRGRPVCRAAYGRRYHALPVSSGRQA